MFLFSSKELITLYIGLELATVSLYALAAIYKTDDSSTEAGIKYLILGAISSAILLFGISLIYGITRTTYIDGVMAYTSQSPVGPIFVIALIMTLLGAGFKLSMVPMHLWTPDVYQGAPTPVTAFISVASKAAGFIFAIRLFSYMFVRLDYIWVPLLSIIALLTMTVGNLMAIPQKNVKRLLAYSTISQAGYILVGFVGASVIGISSVIFYLLAYTVTNIAAFAVVTAFSKATGSDNLDDYAGLAQKEPLLALLFMLSLLSLAGIPPLAGFVGKFYLFYSAMQKGYVWLVVAAALNSTISLYYYLLILKQMYIFDRKKEFPKIKIDFSVKIVLIFTMIVIFIMGIFPGPVLDLTTDIAQSLFFK
jgi:NADH-quinone oxidoreductase subunit N